MGSNETSARRCKHLTALNSLGFDRTASVHENGPHTTEAA
jgi:hypothetical protein